MTKPTFQQALAHSTKVVKEAFHAVIDEIPFETLSSDEVAAIWTDLAAALASGSVSGLRDALSDLREITLGEDGLPSDAFAELERESEEFQIAMAEWIRSEAARLTAAKVESAKHRRKTRPLKFR